MERVAVVVGKKGKERNSGKGSEAGLVLAITTGGRDEKEAE
jgi:hypothetical protein